MARDAHVDRDLAIRTNGEVNAGALRCGACPLKRSVLSVFGPGRKWATNHARQQPMSKTVITITTDDAPTITTPADLAQPQTAMQRGAVRWVRRRRAGVVRAA